MTTPELIQICVQVPTVPPHFKLITREGGKEYVQAFNTSPTSNERHVHTTAAKKAFAKLPTP